MDQVACSVCGAKFREGDHVYEKAKEDAPWSMLADNVRSQSVDLVTSMYADGVDSMGTYHRMLVLTDTLRAVAEQMQHAASQQPIKP